MPRETIVFFGRCINAITHAPRAGVRTVVHRDVARRSVCDNELDLDPPVAQAVSGVPARAGRRTTSLGDAVLGPFQIPPTGDRAEIRGVLPDGWR